MNLLGCISKSVLWTAVIAATSSGCHHADKRECAADGHAHVTVPVPPGAPAVAVTGCSTTDEHRPELETLVTEVRQGLVRIGGLRILESAALTCPPPCLAGQNLSENLSAAAGNIQAVAVDPSDNERTVSQDVFPPPGENWTSGEQIAVRIAILEFVPYRPMQLTATISVHDLLTGQEITTIQGTWCGAKQYEPLADACCSLHQSLHRPPPRIVMEQNQLAPISPQMFLKSVAAELVPAIHAACQSSGHFTIVEAL